VSLTAAEVKAKARALGADLVGIARGDVLDRHPPDPARPQTPGRITPVDSKSVLVLGRRLLTGINRLKGHDDRHKQYSAELVLSDLEEIELKLVYFLEDAGFPSITVPPVHFDPRHYDPKGDTRGPLSLAHAAVEAGLGTLGLNLQLLTPEYGPRVVLTAVLCSVEVESDRRVEQALCLGPSCARCLKVCPGDAVGHWSRDWEACDPHRSPHGFPQLSDHVARIIAAPTPEAQKELIRSEDSFNLWQSILRGAGVITGCRKCADVCPVGADYQMLSDALDAIADSTPEKEQRAARMEADERMRMPETYAAQQRWIGKARQPV
jgi:epoxyqueuosine reductase QueG